ncbi:unnamed protein product, partial [Discosporangium mesarthrocarpum]
VAPPLKKEDSNVIMVMNLPDMLKDHQVRELLSPFGELQRFNLLKASAALQALLYGKSKGTAVFEYKDEDSTQVALSGLAGLPVGKGKLMVQRVPAMMTATLLKPVKPIDNTESPEAAAPSPVIRLSNMVTLEELEDDEEYEDIKSDVVEVCGKYGKVNSIELPRPVNGQQIPGAGQIFVEFSDTDGAEKAKKVLAGRKYSGNPVKAAFYPLDLFQSRVFGPDSSDPSTNGNGGATDASEAKAVEAEPGVQQGGAHGFVIVGEGGADAFPPPAEVGAGGDDEEGDGDMPPDFDAEPMENFEERGPSVTV